MEVDPWLDSTAHREQQPVGVGSDLDCCFRPRLLRVGLLAFRNEHGGRSEVALGEPTYRRLDRHRRQTQSDRLFGVFGCGVDQLDSVFLPPSEYEAILGGGLSVLHRQNPSVKLPLTAEI